MEESKTKNQRTTTISTTRSWYLDDRPLDSFKDLDHFRHQAYVAVLLKSIKELNPPFTIGIFGSWGVGKTSITNELKNSIKSAHELNKVPVVCIDVWKYEGDSLRRQFLLDVQETLKSDKLLHRKYNIVGQLYHERTKEIETEPHLSWHRLKFLSPILLISFVVTLITLGLFLSLGITTPLQVLALSLIVPLLLLFIPEFTRTVVIQLRSTETESRLFSSEQFEQAFEKMVSKAKCNKMVILIDNLDRCSHERVVEILGVVKTYLEPKGKKCIFVIPCDDAAIKQHLKMAYKGLDEAERTVTPEQYADEYLRKFFNASIRIGHFIETEIEPYVATLLNQIRLTEKTLDDDLTRMVQLIGTAFTENPRRIKQFLNNLTAKYLLIKDREDQEPPLINPPISDSLLFLTKVSIIEARFPENFNKFVADDNLYSEVASVPERNEDVSQEVKDILSDAKFRQFLIATKLITVQNPKAFFHLKQSPQEVSIPNYNDFWLSVRTGDRESILSLFDQRDSKSKKAMVEDICSQIKANVSSGYFDNAASIIKVACAVAHKVPQLSGRLAQVVIDSLASYPGVLQRLPLLNPDEVLSLIPSAPRNDSQVVLDEYIKLYSVDPEVTQFEAVDTYALQLSIAETIISNLNLFSKPQLKKARDATPNVKSLSPSLLKIISSTNEAKAALVSPPLVGKAIEQLKVEEISSFAQSEESQAKHFPLIEFILQCQDLEDDNIPEFWAKKCVELLELAAKENNPHLEEYTNRCIDDSESLLSKGPTDSVDQLARLLRERYPQASPDRRLDIALTLSRIRESCSDSEQTETKKILLDQFIQSESPENVARFLVTQAENDFKNLPYHSEAFNKLAQRVVSEENEDTRRKILTSFPDINESKGTSVLVMLLISLIQLPQLQVVVPLIEESSVHFPKSPQGRALVAPLLEQILLRLHEQLPVAERKTLLTLVIHLKEWHTRQHQKEFDNTIVELLTSADASLKELGLGTITTSRDERILSEKRYGQILQQLANWLSKQQYTPDEATTNEIALVVEAKEGILSSNIKLGMIGHIRAMIAPQNPPKYRSKALSLLSSFTKITKNVLEDLIPELVGYAENEGDASIRNEIEETLFSLQSQNMSSDRELWGDFRQYARALITNPDEERKKRGRSLIQRIRRITTNIKK